MQKRGKLEIYRDILSIINERGKIKTTPLLRKSNLSSLRFQNYYQDMLKKEIIIEIKTDTERFVKLTEKGKLFLEKYKTIINFIEEFDL
jgi:predicted transcriptional regulator